MLGCEVIADAIVARGLKRVWCYPGGPIAPLIDALDKRGVSIMVGRTEQGSAFAAEAEARLTGKTQVCMVTSGPGSTNVATVVADCFFDSVPVVFIVGQVSVNDFHRAGQRQRGFQEVDTVGIMTPIAKRVLTCYRASNVDQVISDALFLAEDGRPGPIVIDLPMNIQKEPASSSYVPSYSKLYAGDAIVLLSIVERMIAAERPVIIAGHGVILANAVSELRELAHTLQIPVSQSMMGVGAMPSDDPLCLGFHGHTGNARAGKAIYESDFLLVLGSRLDVRQTGTLPNEFAPNAYIVRADIDCAELDNSRVPNVFNIRGDVRDVLQRLLRLVKNSGNPIFETSDAVKQEFFDANEYRTETKEWLLNG